MTSKTFLATIYCLIDTFKAEYAFVTYSPFLVELQGTIKQNKTTKNELFGEKMLFANKILFTSISILSLEIIVFQF